MFDETGTPMSETTPRNADLEPGPATARASHQSVLSMAAAATVLLTLATVVFVLVISGSYQNYLQEWFGPYLLVAAVAMAALGLWTLLDATDRSEDRATEAHHSHGLPRIGVLLLLPVLLFAVAAPRSLGADAVTELPPLERSTTEPVAFSALSDTDINELSILEFVERYELGDPQLLVGKRVRLLGFVARQDNLPEGQWSINRFRIFCCVADASLYSVVVTGPEQPAGEDTWVEVEGVIDLDASWRLPVLVVDHIDQAAEPEEPYL